MVGPHLVKDVDGWYVDSACASANFDHLTQVESSPIPLNHIHDIVHSGIRLSDHDIAVTVLHLTQDRLDLIRIHVRQRYCIRDRNSALFFLLDCYVRWLLV